MLNNYLLNDQIKVFVPHAIPEGKGKREKEKAFLSGSDWDSGEKKWQKRRKVLRKVSPSLVFPGGACADVFKHFVSLVELL